MLVFSVKYLRAGIEIIFLPFTVVLTFLSDTDTSL